MGKTTPYTAEIGEFRAMSRHLEMTKSQCRANLFCVIKQAPASPRAPRLAPLLFTVAATGLRPDAVASLTTQSSALRSVLSPWSRRRGNRCQLGLSKQSKPPHMRLTYPKKKRNGSNHHKGPLSAFGFALHSHLADGFASRKYFSGGGGGGINPM